MVGDVKFKVHSETVMISFLNTLVLPEIKGNFLMMIMIIMRMMIMIIYRDQQLPRYKRGFTTSAGTCSLFTITTSGENKLGGDSPLERGGGRQRIYWGGEEVEGKSTKCNSYFTMKLIT